MLRTSDGRLLVGEEFGNEITDITAGGDFTGVSAFATGVDTPYGLAESPEGGLFVSEILQGQVTEFTGGGDFSAAAPFVFGLDYPDEIVFEDDGRFLAVQEFLGNVLDISQGGDVSLVPVSNISAGGMFVQLGRLETVNVSSGDEVTVYLDLGDDDQGPLSFESKSEVVRIVDAKPNEGPGFGLMWTSSDPSVAATLVRILAHLRDHEER